MKRVVVVGAGPCGLAALKEMRQAGHDAVLFEQADRLGGVFATAAAYPDLHLTISNWAMAFSDFPDPKRLHYSSAEEYLAYLQSYARHFDLERWISYRSELCQATLQEHGKWLLQVRQQTSPDCSTFLHVQADALIVATGASQVPKPRPQGTEGFTGRIIHSSEYGEAFKKDVAATKKRVLVIGGGESGADIAAELGSLSPGTVSVWLRRTPCIGPRYLNRREEMQQIQANKTEDFPANSFLEAATTNRMSADQNVYSYGLYRRLIWHLRILDSLLSLLCLNGTASNFLRNDQATYVTKNQRMCEAINQNTLELLVCPSISTNGQTCEFNMATGVRQRREFDAIVLCNGFRFTFPWIQLPSQVAPLDNPRSWFLHCFPERLGHCLFFVGYARPHQGGIPVMAEMLCRYIALILNGERQLPPDYAARAQRNEAAAREYYCQSPDLHTLVDYNSFLESVARRVGCEPRLPPSCLLLYNVHMLSVILIVLQFCRVAPLGPWFPALLWAASTIGFLLLHGGLLFKWWFYPHWAVWYRQRGPNANPALLDTVMERVNVWKSTHIVPGFVLLILWSFPNFYIQRILAAVAFPLDMLLRARDVRFRESWGGLLLRPKLFSLHDCRWRFSDLFLP